MITTRCRSLTRPVLGRALVLTALTGFVSVMLPQPLHAQGGIIDRVKAKVKDKTDAATDSITDATFDKATGAVKCVATNAACIKKAFGAGKNVKVVDAKGNPVAPADSAKAVAVGGRRPRGSLAASNTAAASAPSGDAPASAPTQGFGDGSLPQLRLRTGRPRDLQRRLRARQGRRLPKRPPAPARQSRDR